MRTIQRAFRPVFSGLLVVGVFFILSCQAPLLQSVSGGSRLAIELDTSAIPTAAAAAASGSRFLGLDAKIVHVTITRENGASGAYFDKDLAVGTNSGGKPSVTVVAAGIPLGISLVFTATVRDATGAAAFRASQVITLKPDGSSEAIKLTMAPAADYPGLLAIENAAQLLLPAGGSKIVSFVPASGQVGQVLRLSWADPGRAVGIAVSGADGQETTVALLGQGRFGATFTAPGSGTCYVVLHNSGASDVTLSGLSLGLGAGTFPDLVPVAGRTFVNGNGATITLSDFQLGRYELTQSQFRLAMGTVPAANTQGDDFPVQNNTWFEAIACCNRLSMAEGLLPVFHVAVSGADKGSDPFAWGTLPTDAATSASWTVTVDPASAGYRLMTEAEMRYAFHGGRNLETLPYSGSTDANAVAWFSGDSTAVKTLHPVGRKAANSLGIHDLSGNVWEMVLDDQSALTGDQTNPLGPLNASILGGSYNSSGGAGDIGLANCHYGRSKYFIANDVGFRVARNAVAKHSVRFDANGGSGTMAALNIEEMRSATLPANAFTRVGHTFAGWATASNGPASITDGQLFSIGTADVTLYAVWSPNSYTISFNPSGGTGSTPAQAMVYGSPVSLNPNGFAKVGHSFAGWATSSGSSVVAYANGANYAIGPAPVTLYAVWTVNQYGVTFDANIPGSGGSMANQILTYGVPTALSANAFSKAGFTFAGWATAPGGQTAASFANGASLAIGAANIRLYAKWTLNTVIAVGATGPGGGLVCHDKGSYSNGWRYLEIAPTDAFAGTCQPWRSNNAATLVATDASIGGGQANTLALLTASANNWIAGTPSATYYCKNYSNNGYADWFQPSKDELNTAWTGTGTSTVGLHTYYTSTQYSASLFWGERFDSGGFQYYWDYSWAYCRAIRAF